jgi:acetylornithine deacetylase
VPDRLRFEGRLGVRVGETPDQARAALEAAVGDDVELRWTGGQFGPGETPPDHPFVGLVRAAFGSELGSEPPLAGVPYGADMRLFCARGIPCVMVGPPGLELAHAVDERVRVEDLVRLARALARLIVRWG